MNSLEKSAWLEARRRGITGTDVACLAGFNKYRTPLDIYLDKLNLSEPITENEAMYFGNLLEPIVANEYARRTGHNLAEPQIITHPDYPFFLANPDRIVTDANGSKFILECKTTAFMRKEDWGREGSDNIPKHYLCQVAWYCYVCDLPKADIAVLANTNTFRIFTYERNFAFEEQLVAKAYNFWHRHVVKKVPPKPVNNHDIEALYPNSINQEVVANKIIETAAHDMQSIKKKMTALQFEFDAIKRQIQTHMLNSDTLVDSNGRELITWREVKSSRFNSKSFAKDYPQLYEKYKQESATRVFKLTGEKNHDE